MRKVGYPVSVPSGCWLPVGRAEGCWMVAEEDSDSVAEVRVFRVQRVQVGPLLVGQVLGEPIYVLFRELHRLEKGV